MLSIAPARVSGTARRASGSLAARALARAGLAARGILYVLIGLVAILVAVGQYLAAGRPAGRWPQADRVVEEHGQLKAEAELAGRQRRVQRLDIRPLSATARARYAGEWAAVQERFVDEPRQAPAEAQLLVAAVMQERGYPAENHDQIAADLSVEHAGTLDRYRAARQITTNAETGDASTEDLRQAMVHYRALFSELLGQADEAVPETPGTFQAWQETATASLEAEEYPASGAPAAESGDAVVSRTRRR
jgi:hypothetical protein